ncbi:MULTISPECIES: SDR family oxidoreductase [Bacillus]|uniref:Short-chain dehydrogenase n=2 Tax=Bacillus TaxID=1386 RepID=A0A0M4FYA5_9BACI|nr:MULTISPECIES: SDR family oxidoreductase [Bacillus]ALC82275.1 short-chain dehydrogenase [Bacillus gobiensis]MBP1081131.1 short-subunit dehydrogenase [Bacillus capparidis]MED1095815.1 SDR family oxidoreductase [Bacillus capparidis]
MAKTIFITGAATGLGKGTAIGLAKKGHRVIAPVEINAQVTSLREDASAAGVELEVFKMDIRNPEDRSQMAEYDFDIFVANAAINEGGPLGEVPMSIFRDIFEVNVFSTLETAQIAARKFVQKGEGKIIFMSSMAGIMTSPYSGLYAASKHAIEAMAKTMQKELEQFDVKVATINPGPFATGFNDRAVEAKWKWFNEEIHYSPADEMKEIDKGMANQFDPQEMIDKMVEVIPLDSHKFRTVYPPKTEEQMKEQERESWEKEI